MVKINRKIEYALIVLRYLSERESGTLTSAREICDRFNTPFDTTAKVMQVMHLNHLLTSSKGVKGGYELARPLSSISYLELTEMIEGKSSMVACHEGPSENCELLGQCNISGPMKALNSVLLDFFQQLTIDQLFSYHDLKKLSETSVLTYSAQGIS